MLSLSTWAASIIMCFSILLSNKRKGKPDENYQQKPDGKPHYLGALGFARFIASIHIVVGHLYAKGALQDSIYLFKYGFTWVPWFFMLSGFVLTHARLTSRDPSKVDGPLHFLWKRTANIFPMYSFGVLIAGILIIVKGKELPKYWILILQSWLLQSFLPQLPAQTHNPDGLPPGWQPCPGRASLLAFRTGWLLAEPGSPGSGWPLVEPARWARAGSRWPPQRTGCRWAPRRAGCHGAPLRAPCRGTTLQAGPPAPTTAA